MLKFRDIHKSYPMGDTIVHALKGVTLEIEEGDFVAIMGPSGSGKSTMMHVLGLLDVPTSGSYEIGGREVSKLSEDELAIFRRETIGFIFQQFNLLPRMSAAENVALPLIYSESKPDLGRAISFLEQVGLGDRRGHRPNELSGGQQQRVAIARSLINRPNIILADEPTGNLDSKSERDILAILKDLNAQGITVIVVTHEEGIGAQARRRIRMRDGVIQSDERLEPLRHNPAPARAVHAPRPGLWGWLTEVGEHFRQGMQTLAANKVRTGLSMLGIMIGVAAVVAMLAIGNGARKAIEQQLASLGSNLLTLRPGALKVGGVSQGAGGTSRLTLEDANALQQRVPGVHSASPAVQGGSIQIAYHDKNWSTQVVGAAANYADMHAAVPQIGRFFTSEENQHKARVAVLGATVVRELFGSDNPIGETVKINRVIFQVIGVLPEKGATGFRDQDDVIVMPVLTAMKRVLGRTWVDYIDIEAATAEDIEDVQDRTLQLITSRHRIPLSLGDKAFQIFNMADLQQALSESNKTMSLLLASIAAISLLVGGIGIMNIMLVSVTERTREIGLRKAVGARRADILSQFLIESVAVSAVGGIIGIILGWGITFVLSTFIGWATSISIESVVLAFFFSASIGVIFGIYPARQASLLNPIDALRYE
jgi:macrolide transport system ATP-binding/permease protein